MAAAPEASEIVFQTELLSIGRFRCPSHHRAWREENCIGEYPLIVFPRVPVRIRHVDKPELVADPTCITYYNKGQMYFRGLLHQRGDACEFYVVSPTLLAEMAAEFDPRARERPDAPFSFAHGPSDPESYLRQREVYDHVAANADVNVLRVQETMLHVIRRVVGMAFRIRGQREAADRRSGTQRAHRQAVEAARTYLAGRIGQAIQLEDIAAAVHLSPYHLCRIFRRQTGLSLHQYLTQLRLRSSLELLAEGESDLTRLALKLGYSSHAHFTAAFSRAFRIPPSRYRGLNPSKRPAARIRAGI